MKNARNTSRQFWAIHHYRAKIEAQEVQVASRKPQAVAIAGAKANRLGAALLAAGVTHGDVLAALRPIWRDAHRRPPRISNYMTRKEAARREKRRVWAAKRVNRKYERAVRLWEKYGRVCPYEEAW